MGRRSAAALSIAFALGVGCASPPVDEPAVSERDTYLELIARGYYPGRSGQILFVPEPGEVFLRKPMGLYRFMHGSPWDYDRRIPLIFFGPGIVRPGARSEAAVQQDIAPTLLSALGVPPMSTMTGSVLDVLEDDVAPKAVVILVLDGMRADYLDRYADAVPTLTKLRREGASFEAAAVNYTPTVTSAGHTTIATGTDPRIHGIAGNGYWDRNLGADNTLFDGLSPANMMTLGIADLWNLATDGAAVIVTQGTTPRATVSLGGHGACTPNGRPTILAMFDYRSEGFVTNPDCYVLPAYLEAFDPRAVWEAAGSEWHGFAIGSGRELLTTGLFPAFQVDALIRMIEEERVGRDGPADLVLVNFKTPDYVGHYFGPDAPEMPAALAALDEALGRLVAALETATGPGGLLLAVSADHGMPSEPDGTDHDRRFIREVIATIHGALDPEEGRLLFEYLDTANHQLFVDEARLRELGLELADVAAFVETLPYVRAAFGEDVVRRYRTH